MLKLIAKQLRIQWKDWIWMLVFEVVGVVLGVIMLRVILATTDEASYFAMGTVIGCVVAVIFSMLQSLSAIQIYFNVEVSMGVTRKQFFISYIISSFCSNLLSILVLAGLNCLENHLYHSIYAGFDEEINFLPYLMRWGIPAAAAMAVFGGFCGTLIMKFGRKVFWVLWAVWMILCIGGPQVADAVTEKPDSLYGRIGIAISGAVRLVPMNIWIVLIVFLGISAFAGMWMLIRKQQVTA